LNRSAAKNEEGLSVLDFADFRALGELLHRSSRITRSNFVKRAFADSGSPILDESRIKQLRRIIDELLGELPSRQRTIIERCDFGGESQTAVASELGISIRHLFRERNEAQRHIVDALAQRERAATAPAVVTGASDFDSRLRLGDVLDNSGHWREGATVLERLADDVDINEQRMTIELRLCQLYVDAQRLQLARHHAERARELSQRLEPSQRWREFSVDIEFARIAIFSGDVVTASELLPNSVAQLRSRTYQTSSAQIENTIADALILRTTVDLARGDVETARDSIASARSIARDSSQLDARVAISARCLAAMVDVVSGQDIDAAREQLMQCYREALAQGILREAIFAATSAGISYRLGNRAKDAIAFLTPLSDMADVIKSSIMASDFMLVLAHANAEAGALGAAQQYLRKCQDLTQEPRGRGLSQLLASRIHLAKGDYKTALEEAESAETTLTHAGFDRFLHVALLYQAQALSGLGRNDNARRIVSAAIELAQKAQEPRYLAAAYTLMGKVTDQPTYVAAARKLRSKTPPRSH
jgi:tetratricopeptide (TPR) repeat protein